LFFMVTMAIVWASFAAVIAAAGIMWRMSRRLLEVIIQQAEIELDSAIDRVLMTGNSNASIADTATRARNLLTGPSERALRRLYGAEYEQAVTKRAEARKR